MAHPTPRWQQAQTSEEQYWRDHPDLMQYHRSRLQRNARAVEESWRAHGRAGTGTPRVLQIGAAALGEIHFIDSTFARVAVDPLASFYGRNYGDQWTEGVTYIEGVGESLPFPSDSIDVVVYSNLLDHVIDLDSVLTETRRVLRRDGVLWMINHAYDRPAALIRRALEQVQRRTGLPVADTKHLHSLTEADLTRLVKAAGFTIHEHTQQSRAETRQYFRRSKNPIVKLLRGYGPFLVIEHVYVCRK